MFREDFFNQDGHALAVEAEKVVEEMRKDSTRDLCDQLSRAARSIPANIVEGSAHVSYYQYARYLQYSLGSTSELEEHVQTARDINAMSYVDFENLMKRIVPDLTGNCCTRRAPLCPPVNCSTRLRTRSSKSLSRERCCPGVRQTAHSDRARS